MQKSTSLIFKSNLLAVAIITLSSGQVLASEAYQGESVALDPITRSYVLSNDGKEADFSEGGISREASKSIGLDMIMSDNVDLYSIPVACGMPMQLFGGEEYLNLSGDIPYFNVEAPTGDENGLGDIGLTAEYFVENNGAILKAELNFKFPTGDEDVGLGTGSTDFGLGFTGRKRMGNLGFNSTLGYIIRGDATVNKVDVDYGNVFSFSGGAEYRVQKAFWLGANLAYVRSGTSDFDGGFEGDGLQTFDIIPNASYRINTNMTLTADLIFPVQESVVDGDFPADDPDRELSFSFGFNSEF